MPQDFYHTLGVNKDASETDIQKAYRRLARKHHPDLAEDKLMAKEQFQKIQHAYDVLSDPEKRRLYDQLGPNFESYSQAKRGPFSGGTPPGGPMDIDLGDLFGRGGARGASMEDLLKQFGMHGRGAGQPQFGDEPPPTPTRETQEEVTVPFNTAVLGGQHQLQLARDGAASESITMKIPAGIEPGQSLRLRGQGPAGRGGKRGDLLVTIRIAPHPHFERRGNNLRLVVPISVHEAVHGAKIDIPTPHGIVSITVPPVSSSGKLLRLKGMGIKPAGKPPGDLIAELQIVLPSQMSTEQKDALGDWALAIQDEPRRNLAW
jgi:curved DNA-binding protein